MLSIRSQTARTDNLQTIYNFDYSNERHAPREEFEKYRKENTLLRPSFQFNDRQTSDEECDRLNIRTSILGQNIQTSASIDSGFRATTPNMSNKFLSSCTLQCELNECKERERKLQEQVNSLRKVRERRI